MVSNPHIGLYDSVVSAASLSAWVLDITLNVSVTMAIAGRLWWMGRTASSLTSRRTNRYAFPIYVIVECGAILTGANIVCLLLYALKSPGFSTGLSITSQLAVCVYHPSFSFCALSYLILADIDATVDRCANWTNWPTSLLRK